MALAGQIEAADPTNRNPTPRGDYDTARADHILAGVYGDEEQEEAERAHAARFIRRLANRHPCERTCAAPAHTSPDPAALDAHNCPGTCTHPHHGRDIEAAHLARQALGLPILTPSPGADHAPDLRDSRGRPRARCTHCHCLKVIRRDGTLCEHARAGGVRCAGSGSHATKPCTRCKQTKPFDEFYADQTATDGRNSWCKTCNNDARTTARHKTTTKEPAQ